MARKCNIGTKWLEQHGVTVSVPRELAHKVFETELKPSLDTDSLAVAIKDSLLRARTKADDFGAID